MLLSFSFFIYNSLSKHLWIKINHPLLQAGSFQPLLLLYGHHSCRRFLSSLGITWIVGFPVKMKCEVRGGRKFSEDLERLGIVVMLCGH